MFRVFVVVFFLFSVPLTSFADLLVFDEFIIPDGNNFSNQSGFYDSVSKKYQVAHNANKQGRVTYIDQFTHQVSSVDFKGLEEAAGESDDSSWQVGVTSFWQDPLTGNIRAAGFSSNQAGAKVEAVYWLDANTPVAFETSALGDFNQAYISAQSANGSYAVGVVDSKPAVFNFLSQELSILSPGFDINGNELTGVATGISDDGTVISAISYEGANPQPAYYLNQELKLPVLGNQYINLGVFFASSNDGSVLAGALVTNPDIDFNADYHGVLVDAQTSLVLEDFGTGTFVQDVINDPFTGNIVAAVNYLNLNEITLPYLFFEDSGLVSVLNLFPNFTGTRIIDLIPLPNSVAIISDTGFFGGVHQTVSATAEPDSLVYIIASLFIYLIFRFRPVLKIGFIFR